MLKKKKKYADKTKLAREIVKNIDQQFNESIVEWWVTWI